MVNQSTMSKIIKSVLLLLVFNSPIWAQIKINVLLNPPYSPYVSDYLALEGKGIIIVTNTSQTEYRIKFAGSIEGLQNGIKGETDPNYRLPQPIILRGGEMRTINADNDIFGIKRSDIITNLSEQQQNGIIRSGILPEGTYKYCVKALDYTTGQLLSDLGMGCTIVTIQYPEPPILISPNCGAEVFQREPQNLSFTWSPVINRLQGVPVFYDLYLLRLATDQQDAQDLMTAAIKFGSGNPIKITDLTTSNYIFTAFDPTLLTGRYAWAVVAKDLTGRTLFHNDGISSICTFMLRDASGLDGAVVQAPAIRPTCGCKTDFPVDNIVKNSMVKAGTAVKVGDFDMTIVDATPIDGKMKGTGKINLPIINSKFVTVRVRFDGLSINQAGQMLEGTITAIKRADGAGLMPNSDPLAPKLLPFSSQQAEKLDQYFKANAQQLASQAVTAAQSIGLELPFGIDKNSSPYTIAIMDLRITPFEAVFDAAVAIPLPDGSTTIGLGAKDVCVSPTNLCGSAMLYLSQDINMPQIGLNLKGAEPNDLARNPGTYVIFDRDGFKSFHIKAEYDFPLGTIQRKDNDGKITATLEADCQKWTDWVASITMPEFYISGMKDFSFSLESGGYYDHSSLKNPENLPKIDEKKTLATPDWMGFFMQKVKVTMPEAFKSIDGKPITFSADNLIIDGGGVTGSLNANNILTLDKGSLGGWYFSMDRVGIDFLNNSFVKGGLYGKVILPISGENTDVGSQLDYSCTLSNPQGGLAFQFDIKLKNDLNVPIWIAKAGFKQGSNITISNDGQGFLAMAQLSGSLDIETKVAPVGKIKFVQIEFENMRIKTTSEYFQVEKFNAGLNSPQRYLSGDDTNESGGFPVSLSKFVPRIQGAGGRVKIGIQFDLGITLADIEILPSASATMTLWSQVDFQGGRPKWRFAGAEVSRVKIAGDLGPVNVEGEIEFFNNDQKFGDGIRGALQATIIGAGKIDANALFGKVSNYSYFYVDINYYSNPPKIQLCSAPGPPLAIAGFGGGVYYNLRQNPLGGEITTTSTNPMERYTPQQGLLGFLGNIILTDNTGSLYAFKGTLNVTLTDKLEPTDASILIQGAVFPSNPRDPFKGAMVKLEGAISYDFRNTVLDAFLNTEMAMSPFSASSKKQKIFHLNVNFTTSRGYLKIGDPNNRISVPMPGLPPISLPNLQCYLMLGNDGIPDAVQPPTPIYESLNSMGLLNKISSRQASFSVIFGGAIGSPPTEFKLGFLKLTAGAQMGFDVSLSHYDTDCNGKTDGNKIGFEGWYASGQIWAYAMGAMSLYVDLFGLNEDFEIFKVEAGALVMGGLPNPTWGKGIIYGKYSILANRVRGSVAFQMGFGENGQQSCNAQSTDPLKGVSIIENIDPEKGKQGVDIGKNISVSLNFPLDRPFKVEFTNSDGSTRTEYFQIILEKMEIWNTETNQMVSTIDPSVAEDKKVVVTPSNDNYLVTFYTRSAFAPQTNHRLELSFKVLKEDGSQIGKSQGVFIEDKYIFKTGDCPKTIKDYVVYANPLPNQRYFMTGESKQGFIEVTQLHLCMLENPNWTMEIQFDGGIVNGVQTSPAKYQNGYISFAIPTLAANSIYNMKLKQTRNPNSPNTSILGRSRNIYIGNYRGTEGSTVNYQTNALAGENNSAVVVTLWNMYFKTSQYTTLDQKMATFGTSNTTTKSGYGTYYTGNFVGSEGFDQYDAIGYPYIKNGVLTQVPLVSITENKSSASFMGRTPANAWQQNYVKPMYDRIAYVRSNIWWWNWHPINGRGRDYISILGYAPPFNKSEIPFGYFYLEFKDILKSF